MMKVYDTKTGKIVNVAHMRTYFNELLYLKLEDGTVVNTNELKRYATINKVS